MDALRMLVLVLLAACGNTPQTVSPPPSLPKLTPATPPPPRPAPVRVEPSVPAPAEPAPTPEPTAAASTPAPQREPISCEAQGLVQSEEGHGCREKQFTDYCRASMEVDEEEQLTVSRILNGLHLSDCAEVERYLERQPTLILPPHGQKISDLRPIATLKMLRTLHLANNRIVDISPLAALHELEVLNLRQNAISDLSPLASLNKLRRLDIAGNDARDLSALAKIPHLIRVQTGSASDPMAIEKREPVTMRDISTGTLE